MRQTRIALAATCGFFLVVWTALPGGQGGRLGYHGFGWIQVFAFVGVTVAIAVLCATAASRPARLGAVTGAAAAVGTFALVGPLHDSSGLSVIFRLLVVGMAGALVWTTLPARRWRAPLHDNELGLAVLLGGVATVLCWALATRTSLLGLILSAGAFVAAGYGARDRGAWARWLSGGLVTVLFVDLLTDPRGAAGVVALLVGAGTLAAVVVAERTATEAPPVADPERLDPPVAVAAVPAAAGSPWAAPAPVMLAHGYASFGQRFGGSLIDGLVGLLFDIPALVLLIAAVAASTASPDVAIVLLVAVLVVSPLCSLAAAIHYMIQVGRTGQYYGHRAMGIRVVDATSGQPVGAGRVFMRGMCRVLSMLPLGIGYFAMLFDPRGQTWHDRLARTVVVTAAPLPAPVPDATVVGARTRKFS